MRVSGIFGWEADLAYRPEFFEGDDDDLDLFLGSNVTTFMVNAMSVTPKRRSKNDTNSA